MLVLALTIAVGVEGKPADAPAHVQTGPWKSDYKLFGSPSFTDAISACSSIVFAFAGTPGYFNIISEMRNPRVYSRSVFMSQGFITAIYIAIGIVVYYFCGSYVASPALGSAGDTMKKVCYGLALPGLLVSTILLSHVSTFCISGSVLSSNIPSSFRLNSSSSEFSVDPSISPRTQKLTGPSGSAAPPQSSSAPTSSPAQSPYSVVSSPLSVLYSVPFSISNLLVSCGSTIIGVWERHQNLPDGSLWSVGVPSLLLLEVS